MPQQQTLPMMPLEPGERWRAPYACRSSLSRGRLLAEPASPTRSHFQRDRDRIIHATAFRRLKHKTQVFVSPDGDHFRTRLTHTIEVAQIARALARALGLDEDLAEALALAHDLGHTPFGHTGEDALSECMAGHGGFDHNAQTLRIVTRLERRYAEFDGLNLSWETLEGLVKHNGPLLRADGPPMPRYEAAGVPAAILDYDREHNLWLDSFASAEAQAAAIADDIAYDAHDLDDGLRAGLFGLAELRRLPFLAELRDEIEARYPALEETRAVNELVRRVITRFVEDVIGESQARIAALAPADADAIRRADKTCRRVLGHGWKPPIARSRASSTRTCTGIRASRWSVSGRRRSCAIFSDASYPIPLRCRANGPRGCDAMEEGRLARRVADYIAGMTDSYACDEHARLFDATPSLR